MDKIDDELLEVLEDLLPKTAHRETPKHNTLYLSRAAGKSKLNFENALKLDKDKIIYYVNKRYGDRYIVPKDKYEYQQKVSKEFQQFAKIVYEKNVNCQGVIACKTVEEYNDPNNYFLHDLTEKEFNFVKNFLMYHFIILKK